MDDYVQRGRAIGALSGSASESSYDSRVVPRWIVVSGLPASGKSTLGRRLAEALELDLLDKDELLEALFEEHTSVESASRRALSRQADVELVRQARQRHGAVVVSFWRRPELSVSSGTPTEWLATLDDVVEVYCACSPATAARRFSARVRHSAHGDSAKPPSEIIAQFNALADLGPLGIGRTVTVDTENAPSLEGLVAQIYQ